jgi:O-antigen ligase
MDKQLINRALSSRLPIWETGVEMYLDNPVNGVGARGFRYAYNDYAADGDIYVDKDRGIGAYHSHNLIIEIASETGTIGLIGFLIFCIYFTSVWLKAEKQCRFAASPFALALFVALFPFNTHFAFYAGAWTQVMFWLLSLMLASLYCLGHQEKT